MKATGGNISPVGGGTRRRGRERLAGRQEEKKETKRLHFQVLSRDVAGKLRLRQIKAYSTLFPRLLAMMEKVILRA